MKISPRLTWQALMPLYRVSFPFILLVVHQSSLMSILGPLAPSSFPSALASAPSPHPRAYLRLSPPTARLRCPHSLCHTEDWQHARNVPPSLVPALLPRALSLLRD